MHSNFVDRIMARVDGALATIWITFLVELEAPADPDRLRRALEALVRETPRLNLAWAREAHDFVPRARTGAELERALQVSDQPAGFEARLHTLIRTPVELTREVPFRVSLCPSSGEGAHLLGLQLHHALGDARSMLFLLRRLWQHYADVAGAHPPLAAPGMTDRKVFATLLRRPWDLRALSSASSRLLSRRGMALRHRGLEPAYPCALAFRVTLPSSVDPARYSGLFYGALLAGVLAHPGGISLEAPVRFRVPVDLRRELGLEPSLENACSAIPVELPAEVLARGAERPERLEGLVPAAIRALVERGVHRATLLEVCAVERLSSDAQLRGHVRPDLLAPRRANTLVATYLGRIDRYFNDFPHPMGRMAGHTPTWGANGFVYRDRLHMSISAFDRLWLPEDLEGFAAGAIRWLEQTCRLEVERIR